MEWNTLIKRTAERSGFSASDTARMLNSFLDELACAMKTDDRVYLRTDFGSFAVKSSGGRETGRERSITKTRRVPLFKRGKGLEKLLRQADEDYMAALMDKKSEEDVSKR